MHRSGTSVITGLLNAHGLNLGPEHQLLGSSPTNPTGHFEHTGILQINEALLHKFGGSWNSPPKLAPMWETGAELHGLAAEAAAHIRNLADRGPWGWKEPRTTMLLPFWQRLVPDLRYVICIRNPLEVAQSLVKRDGMTMKAGLELWRSYTRAALGHTSGCFRILTFYQDYFDNPLRELNRLANLLPVGKDRRSLQMCESPRAHASTPPPWRGRTPVRFAGTRGLQAALSAPQGFAAPLSVKNPAPVRP
jgi:hypothetical protein